MMNGMNPRTREEGADRDRHARLVEQELQTPGDGEAAKDSIDRGNGAEPLVPLDRQRRPFSLDRFGHPDPLFQLLGALLAFPEQEREVQGDGGAEDEERDEEENH